MARVLLVDFDVVPAPDRRAVQLLAIMKALAPRYDLDVLTVKSPELAYVDRFMRSRMLRVPIGTDSLAEQIEAFRRAVRRQLEGSEYDVVHFRSAWAGLPACEMKADVGARLVFEPTLSPLTEPRAADPELARTLSEEEDVCVRAADRLIVPTEIARAHLVARGLDEQRVVLIPPGVDVDQFDWEPSDEPARPRVLYSGFLSGGRGVRLLMQAMAQVRAKRNAELVLVGHVDPDFQPALDEAIRLNGLDANVTLVGPVDHDEMPRVLSTATVCVAPSAADAAERPLAPFPLKILEYMACRRPVVAARRTIVEEVVRHEVDALMFEPGSVEGLAGAIIRLLEDEPLRTRIADAAYATARTRFPASAARRRFLEVYRTLAPGTATLSRSGIVPAPGLSTAPDTTTARHVLIPEEAGPPGGPGSGHETP